MRIITKIDSLYEGETSMSINEQPIATYIVEDFSEDEGNHEYESKEDVPKTSAQELQSSSCSSQCPL